MKKCPGPLTWQALVDGEEDGARYAAHLERCPACRAVYNEIREAAELAGRLRCSAELPPGFAAPWRRKPALASPRPAPSRRGLLRRCCLPPPERPRYCWIRASGAGG